MTPPTRPGRPVAANTVASPFLRWAGGKRTLQQLIVDAFPTDFDPAQHRYFEPFVGGCAVMFASEAFIPGHRVVINDANRELATTYRALRDDVDAVIVDLANYAKQNTLEDYLHARARHLTLTDGELPAWFIYLNKTCFNGLWRVNSSGQYNVPYGKLATPAILDEPTLRAAARRLQGVDIRTGSYIDAVRDATAGDVVYFDPPYLPLTASSFTKYAKDDFTLNDQRELANLIADLTQRGVRVIMSNAHTTVPDPNSTTGTGLTVSIYGDVLDLRELHVARSVGASAHTRVRAREILGFNYPLPAVLNAALPTLPDTRPVLAAA